FPRWPSLTPGRASAVQTPVLRAIGPSGSRVRPGRGRAERLPGHSPLALCRWEPAGFELNQRGKGACGVTPLGARRSDLRSAPARSEPDREGGPEMMIPSVLWETDWRWIAVRALAALFFGLTALMWPGITVYALVILFGAYAFVDGVFTLVAAFTTGRRGWNALAWILAGLL